MREQYKSHERCLRNFAQSKTNIRYWNITWFGVKYDTSRQLLRIHQKHLNTHPPQTVGVQKNHKEWNISMFRAPEVETNRANIYRHFYGDYQL